MLTPTNELESDRRFHCLKLGWVALDTETGAYLRRSSGRSKAGRAAKYFLHRDSKTFDATTIRAMNDAEAIDKANEALKGGAE